MESESLFKKCAACGKLVSKSASLCPQCGHKTVKSYKLKVICLIFIILIIIGNLSSNKDIKNPTLASQQQQTATANRSTASENNAHPDDKWEQEIAVSKIDDSSVVTLAIEANNEIKGWLMSAIPKLYIRCKENSTDLFIVTQTSADIEDIYGGHTVEIRLDKGNAFKQRWSASTDNNSLFASNAVDLSKRIAAAEKMVVRFTPFNGNPQVMEFDVAGLKTHLELVAKTCKWSYTNNKEKK